MNHLDEGVLLSLRDGVAGPSSTSASAHLEGCEECREALAELQLRERSVAAALLSLDEEWDVEAARAAVRERVSQASAREAGATSLARRRTRAAGWTLGRAAGWVLLTAAGAAALPGSPVRGWVQGIFAPDTALVAEPEAAVEGGTSLTSAPSPEEVGVRLVPASAALRVVLLDATPGTEIRVQWVVGLQAALFAPAGSRFNTAAAEGRLEARLTPGPVRIELPRDEIPVSLEVEGRVYLRGGPDGLEIDGPVVDRSDAEVVFRIPEA